MADDLLYKIDKSKSDIETLLDRHQRLVYSMLSKTNQLSNQDAESVAWEALWYALVTFDVFSKNEFSSYACVVIKNAINAELRKCYHVKQPKHVYVEMEECYQQVVTIEDTRGTAAIYLIFEEYVAGKTGRVKDILLAWYASDFESSPTNIGKICACAPTNVSRIQATFRAYVTRRLKQEEL